VVVGQQSLTAFSSPAIWGRYLLPRLLRPAAAATSEGELEINQERAEEAMDGESEIRNDAPSDDGISNRMRAAVGDLSSRMRTAVGVTKTDLGKSILPIVVLFGMVVLTVAVIVWIRFFGGAAIVGDAAYGVLGLLFVAATGLTGFLWRR